METVKFVAGNAFVFAFAFFACYWRGLGVPLLFISGVYTGLFLVLMIYIYTHEEE